MQAATWPDSSLGEALRPSDRLRMNGPGPTSSLFWPQHIRYSGPNISVILAPTSSLFWPQHIRYYADPNPLSFFSRALSLGGLFSGDRVACLDRRCSTAVGGRGRRHSIKAGRRQVQPLDPRHQHGYSLQTYHIMQLSHD